MEQDWQRLTREAERVHTRYQREVVEAFWLCPWAKAARSGGHVNMRVSFMTRADPGEALRFIDASMHDPAIEIGMLICPLLELDSLAFEHFVAEVRALDAGRSPRGAQRLALAHFHPHAAADLTTPERLVPFLRRAPDPMIQSVRTEVLERVRGGEDQGTRFIDPGMLDLSALTAGGPVLPLAARVAQHNARQVQRIGIEQLEAVISDILEDRYKSYGAIGVNTPTRAHIGDATIATQSNKLEKTETRDA
jgi:hypothetical protein